MCISELRDLNGSLRDTYKELKTFNRKLKTLIGRWESETLGGGLQYPLFRRGSLTPYRRSLTSYMFVPIRKMEK